MLLIAINDWLHIFKFSDNLRVNIYLFICVFLFPGVTFLLFSVWTSFACRLWKWKSIVTNNEQYLVYRARDNYPKRCTLCPLSYIKCSGVAFRCTLRGMCCSVQCWIQYGGRMVWLEIWEMILRNITDQKSCTSCILYGSDYIWNVIYNLV